MLVLPVDEDSWGFRACLAVGLALLVLDVVLPRVFGRRVRLLWPQRLPRRLALPRARPLDHETFRRRKRKLERQLRALESGCDDAGAATESDVATGDERRSLALKQRQKKKLTKKKTKSRVVLPGDKTETEAEQSEAASTVRRRMKKRVSFDMTRNEFDKSRAEEENKPRDAHTASVEEATVAPQADTPTATTADPHDSDVAQTKPPSRPDPFSLVDDDFPWQLPNYARTSAAPPTSVIQPPMFASQPAPSVAPQAAALNIRRPLGHFNGSTSVSSSSVSLVGGTTSSLELKHKPFWKRTPSKERNPSPAKERNPSPAKMTARTSPVSLDTAPAPDAASVPVAPDSSFGSTRFGSSTVSTGSSAADAPRLLFRPDPAMRPSPVPMRTQTNPFFPKSWRVPSPKPPLHSRPATSTIPAPAVSTSQISTPAPQSKLRTPKIIRRITFDEDMMGALATPSDASPLITETARKRQRENDVLEALDAVGLPWHKRRG